MKKLLVTLLFIIISILSIQAQYTKLFDFSSASSQAAIPSADFVSVGAFLYGTTNYGGTSYAGTVFKIKPDGTGYDTLICFRGPNGSLPKGSLIYDGSYLYGMTLGGGLNNKGTIFKIKPDGTGFLMLHDFGSAKCDPAGIPYYSI